MNDLLDTPLTDWLDAFERELPTDLALVTLEPDLLGHHVDVEAQADTLDELLAFAQALSRSPLVARVETLDTAAEAETEDCADLHTDSGSVSAPAGLLRMRWRLSLSQ